MENCEFNQSLNSEKGLKLTGYDRIYSTHPEFRIWMNKINGDNQHIYCTACNIRIQARNDIATGHFNSLKHLKKCEKENPTIKKKPKSSFNFDNIFRMHPEYHFWIERVEQDDTKVYCKYCEFDMQAREYTINQHAVSFGHLKRYKLKTGDFTEGEKKVAIAELNIASLIASRNIPFQFCDYLTPILKEIIDDSDIIDDFELCRFKVRRIIEKIIGPEEKKNLQSFLQNQLFAVIIDESTDMTLQHSMCIIVRYYDYKLGRIRECLWDIIEMYVDEDSAANAQQIYEKLIKSFEDEEIPLENIYSFCSDTCNVMFGSVESVARKLKERLPDIILVKCNCHIQHLCMKYALKSIPSSCEKLLSSIYCYINSGSGKRLHRWKLEQESFDLDPLNILEPGFTRWLTITQCIRRILRRWTALVSYFRGEVALENSAVAQNILNELNQPVTLLHLKFLLYILSKMTGANELLQSVKPIFSESEHRMTELYGELLRLYIKPEYLLQTDINDIDPECKNNPQYLKGIDSINIGIDAQQLIHKEGYIDEETKNEFLSNCQTLLITACKELKKRFNFGEEWIRQRTALHPKNVLDPSYHQNEYPTLDPVLDVFLPSIDSSRRKLINDEWDKIAKIPFSPLITDGEQIDIFWAKISEYADDNGIKLFKNLSEFALIAMLPPNSNAGAERLWSKVLLEKNKYRNRLDFKILRALLFTSQYDLYSKETAGSLICTDEMIKQTVFIGTRDKKTPILQEDAEDSFDNNHDYAIIEKKKCMEEEEQYTRKHQKVNYINKKTSTKPGDYDIWDYF